MISRVMFPQLLEALIPHYCKKVLIQCVIYPVFKINITVIFKKCPPVVKNRSMYATQRNVTRLLVVKLVTSKYKKCVLFDGVLDKFKGKIL